MHLHSLKHTRPELAPIVNHVYIPKFNVKRYSPYLYAGEKTPEYFNLRYFQTSNRDNSVKLGEPGPSQRLIMGIESSFDDSCAGIVSSCGRVLANEKKQFMGNYGLEDAPLRAAEHHKITLPGVVRDAMKKANLTSLRDLEALAVTIGPGQAHSLNEGIRFAKQLANENDLPLIPVSHIEAHVMTPRLVQAGLGQLKESEFPFLSVLVTGGHTEFVLTRGVGLHTIMGFTVDIAVGSYLDRVAKIFEKELH